MSQTNTNNGQNWNQISGRGGQVQGAPNGSGRGDRHNSHKNNSIAKYSFEGKIKDGPISKLQLQKQSIDPLNWRRLVTLFLYYAQTKITEASMRSSVPNMTESKMTSCRIIRTPTGSLLHTMCKLALSTQKPIQNLMGHDQYFSKPWNRLTS